MTMPDPKHLRNSRLAFWASKYGELSTRFLEIPNYNAGHQSVDSAPFTSSILNS